MLGAAVPAKRNVLASGKVDVIRVGEEVPGRLMREALQDLCYGGAKVIPDGSGAALAAQKGTTHRRPSTL
jgi:hypothetical protein